MWRRLHVGRWTARVANETHGFNLFFGIRVCLNICDISTYLYFDTCSAGKDVPRIYKSGRLSLDTPEPGESIPHGHMLFL
jgi:hypothetical protein